MKPLVLASEAEMAEALSRLVRRAAEEGVRARGRFRLALTGGSSARLYGRLAEEALPWDAIHLFWGDERLVPADDPDSNFRVAQELLLRRVSVRVTNLHRMPGELADARLAAAEYEAELCRAAGPGPLLDFVHLGMGADGHVCSLFPNHPLLEERERLVAAVEDSPKPPPRRLTLTLPVLQGAGELCFTVAGEDKAAAVREVLEHPGSRLPGALASRRSGPVHWLLDRGAASHLASSERGDA